MQHQATTKRKKKKNIKEQHRSKHSTFLPQQMQSPTVHLPHLDKEVCTSRCSLCYSADLNDILRRVLLRYQYIAHFHVVDAFSYPLIASLFGDYECPRSNEGTSSNTHSAVSSTFSADPSWTLKFYDLLPLKKGSSKRRCAMVCRALYRRIERKLSNIHQQQLFEQQRYMGSSSSVAEPRDDLSWMRCLTEEVEQLLLPGDCQPSPDEQIEQRNRITQAASDKAEDLGEDEEDERGEEYEEACAWGQFRNDVRRFAVSRMFPFLSAVSASLPLSSTTTTTSPPPATTLSALQKGLSHKKRYELDCFAPQLHRWVQQAAAAAAAATTTTPLSPSSLRLTTQVPSASSSSTVARPPPGRVVLVDIGAGQGYLSAKMVRDYGYTVIAVERDDTQVHGSIRRSGVLQLLEQEGEHEEEKEKDTVAKAMTTTDRNERRRRHDDVSKTGKRMRREDDDDDKINGDGDDVDRTTTAVPNTTSHSASTTTDDSSATTVGTNTEMRGGRTAVKTTTTTTTRRTAGRGKLIVCQADISASTTVESFETALLAALHCSDQRSSSSSMIDPPAVSFVLFSLHACGSLSHNMLRLFSEWRAREKTSSSSSWKSRCLLCCNVGCCYNLIAQPLSWRRRVNQGGGCEEGVKWEGAVATGSRSKEEGGAAAADAAACGCNGLSVQVEEEPRDGAPLSALAKMFMATHGAAEYEGRSWDLGGSDVPCHVVEAAKPTSPFHPSAAATICCRPQEEVPESDKGMEPTAQRTSLPLRLTRNMLMAALQAPTHWCSRRWTTDPYFTEKEEKEEEEGVRLLKDTIDSLFFRSALQLGFHQILHVENLSRIGRVPSRASSKREFPPPPTSKAASSQRHPAALPDTTKNGESSTSTTTSRRQCEATMIPQQTEETRRDHKRQSEEEEKREFVEYALANFQRVQRRLVVAEEGGTVTTTEAVGTVKVFMKKSKQLLAESEKNTSRRNKPDEAQQQQQPLDNTSTTTTSTAATTANDKVDAWTRQLEALFDQLRSPMTTTGGRGGEMGNHVEYCSPSPPVAAAARSGGWDTTLTKKGDAKLQLAVVWVVKSLVGHMLESMVVLDRAVYLQEQLLQKQQQSQQEQKQEPQQEKPEPHCHNEGFKKGDDEMVVDHEDDDGDARIQIVPLFDLSESPRNLAVVAW
jgi:hypothetical protein